ncbi:hypothetical protein [Alkanindiges illinoisensis]|nr:hypothetical protein [Alkanindiges illinoisensis]
MKLRQAPARPSTQFDLICYNRLTASNFAIPQSTLAKLIAKIKAGAK